MGEYETEQRLAEVHDMTPVIPAHIVRKGLFWTTVIVHETPRKDRKFRGRTKAKAMKKFWVWLLNEGR